MGTTLLWDLHVPVIIVTHVHVGPKHACTKSRSHLFHDSAYCYVCVCVCGCVCVCVCERERREN